MSARATVLVVEDTEALRDYVTQILEDIGGFHVVAVATGVEALRHMARAEHSCAAVVLDCKMPGMDGIEVLDSLRQERPDLPVVVVSADPGNRTTALVRGARAFVEKVPGEYMKNLLAVLEDTLPGR